MLIFHNESFKEFIKRIISMPSFNKSRCSLALCKVCDFSSCVRLRLYGAIYLPDSFELMLRHCANLKTIRYESTSLNRIVADESDRVIVAQGWIWTVLFVGPIPLNSRYIIVSD